MCTYKHECLEKADMMEETEDRFRLRVLANIVLPKMLQNASKMLPAWEQNFHERNHGTHHHGFVMVSINHI